MLKAQKLCRGDTIGIISPSWGGAGAFPHRVELGIQHLNKLGFKVELAAHAKSNLGFTSDTPANRAQDTHDLFINPDIKAIISSIGGNHACHLLPLLDYDLIARNPKMFMGFSDITVLNVALWKKAGLVTFNGPALLTDFAEYPQMLAYTQEYFLRAVTEADPIGIVEPSLYWTEEFLDWEEKKDLERPRHLHESSGWTWLKDGQGEGILIGGCLESLQHLRGTEYWPNWDNAIFFFETSEEKPSPETVDALLMDYENMGIFEKLRGLLVGRPMFYSEDEKKALNERILERTREFKFPVITNMDFGHTSPQMTIPIGCRARIDSASKSFEILESAVL